MEMITYGKLLTMLKKTYKEQLREADMFIRFNPWIKNYTEGPEALTNIPCLGTIHKASYTCQLSIKKGIKNVYDINVSIGNIGNICIGGFRRSNVSGRYEIYFTDSKKYGDKSVEEAALLIHQDWVKRTISSVEEGIKKMDESYKKKNEDYERFRSEVLEYAYSSQRELDKEFSRLKVETASAAT